MPGELIAKIMVEHGLAGAFGESGSGGGNTSSGSAGSQQNANFVKKTAKTQTGLLETIKNSQGFAVAKAAGISFTLSSILRQSQLFTGFLGALFQILGAMVDAVLMFLWPLFVPILKFLANRAFPALRSLLETITNFLAPWGRKLLKLYESFPPEMRAIIDWLLAGIVTFFLGKWLGILGWFRRKSGAQRATMITWLIKIHAALLLSNKTAKVGGFLGAGGAKFMKFLMPLLKGIGLLVTFFTGGLFLPVLIAIGLAVALLVPLLKFFKKQDTDAVALRSGQRILGKGVIAEIEKEVQDVMDRGIDYAKVKEELQWLLDLFVNWNSNVDTYFDKQKETLQELIDSFVNWAATADTYLEAQKTTLHNLIDGAKDLWDDFFGSDDEKSSGPAPPAPTAQVYKLPGYLTPPTVTAGSMGIHTTAQGYVAPSSEPTVNLNIELREGSRPWEVMVQDGGKNGEWVTKVKYMELLNHVKRVDTD